VTSFHFSDAETPNEIQFLLELYIHITLTNCTENLIVAQLVKTFPASYGTPKFTAVSTRARHWTLALCRSFQSTSSFFKGHFNIILQFTPMSAKWPLRLRPSYRKFLCISPFPMRATCPAYLFHLRVTKYLVKNIQIMELITLWFSWVLLVHPGIFFSIFVKKSTIYILPLYRETRFHTRIKHIMKVHVWNSKAKFGKYIGQNK
jgi:hypothetical protein